MKIQMDIEVDNRNERCVRIIESKTGLGWKGP